MSPPYLHPTQHMALQFNSHLLYLGASFLEPNRTGFSLTLCWINWVSTVFIVPVTVKCLTQGDIDPIETLLWCTPYLWVYGTPLPVRFDSLDIGLQMVDLENPILLLSFYIFLLPFYFGFLELLQCISLISFVSGYIRLNVLYLIVWFYCNLLHALIEWGNCKEKYMIDV